MKNLANCKPTEFFAQTVRIKKNVESWLTSNDIKEIRSRLPELEKETAGMTTEEKGEMLIRNQKKLNEQATKNFLDILEFLLDKNASKTLELMALCCFVEPSHVDDYEMAEYMDAITDLITNASVLRFFTSLTQLGQTNISIASKT